MVTERLYYENQYLVNFSTSIKKQAQDHNGKWYVVLNETAFYPTGGGQPHDIGEIAGNEVVDVEEVEGEIRHFLHSPLSVISEDVSCSIDWNRRFDHMQQHAGQHILSAAFEEIYGYRTTSFHLGNEICTIDLDIPQLNVHEAGHVEVYINEVIIKNLPIETKWVTEEEAMSFPLRKTLSVTDEIRLVIIPDFDYNGCGGTHPDSTGQVQAIKILEWEKQKNGIRLTFVCGRRVLNQLQLKHDTITKMKPVLNASEEKLLEAVNSLKEREKSLDKEHQATLVMLMEYEAQQFINNASPFGSENWKMIAESFEGKTMQDLQKLAKTMLSKTNESMVISLVSKYEGKLQVVVGRTGDVTVSMKTWVNLFLPEIDGRGGGNDTFAQGGGESSMSASDLLALALGKLEKELTY
ncbi:alanyl-tRNA editing protein [Peribacillus alkalitolerans]|uniref:alanyl-tRNA editing protein n=1 Tax=Peribacillus alkalitolerans TaxID=1550385 RepID=UPI0013D434D5|nr:DHHA1 domain-containing protein [Peribacillus alkalitolerans]